MRTVIVGAGPSGLFTAIALARRGHDVFVVDRDAGPPAAGVDAAWRRRGVMQFHHAHTFRRQVVDVLQDEMPDVLDELTAAGATVATSPDDRPVALLCRRMIFERVLRGTAKAQRGVTLITGHVDTLLQERSRATGVAVDGSTLACDVVVDASGRSSRFTGDLRPPAEGGDCGAVYVTRQYRLRHGATAGPVNSPIGLSFGFRVISPSRSSTTAARFRSPSHTTESTNSCAGCGMTTSSTTPYAPSRGWLSGSNRHGRNRSRRRCPAGGCTTPTVASSTTQAGRFCLVWSQSGTRCAPRRHWPDAVWRWR